GEAKPIAANADKGMFVDAPLVVTGTYGQGAITVVTVDVSNPEMQAKMDPQYWISFWTSVAGWRQNTRFFTGAQVDANNHLPAGVPQDPNIKDMVTNPKLIPLGEKIPQDVDLTEVTAIRILVALAFLALYWLVAGPV